MLDLLRREGAAGGAEGVGVELLARTTVFLLDRMFDGQPVAVPARDVRRIEALERARLDDDVLEDLVERVADVDGAVGVRRAVVQHEARPTARDLTQAAVGVLGLPTREQRRLALRQVGLHGEARLREIDRLFVVGHWIIR